MRTFEKNFTYLLLNIIPYRHLLPDRRRTIQNALSFGTEADIRREAILSLEELVRSSYMTREAASIEGENVSVTYAKLSGGYRILLHVPLEEWRRMFKDEAPVGPPQPHTADTWKGSVGDGVSATLDVFPKLIKSLAINERNGTLLQKIDMLLARLSDWLRLGALKLFLVEERIGEASEEYACLATVPEAVYKGSRVYRRFSALEPGGIDYLEEPSGMGAPRISDGTTIVSVPVMAMGEHWGVLEAALPGGSPDETMKSRLATAVGTIAQLIENNVRLENLISIDKLTGVFNRQFYDMQLPIEIERATRAGSKLSMLLLDLDDFREINNTLGHKKGDEALVIITDLIRRNLRKIDLPFRYGGEEFVILLPGTAQKEAIHTAERLRSVIEGNKDFRDHHDIVRPITVSIGIAVFPDDATSDEGLFICADKAMYKAKKLGKNRVELYKR
jgi:diguanylate cyclase (GGDEF)-like protein